MRAHHTVLMVAIGLMVVGFLLIQFWSPAFGAELVKTDFWDSWRSIQRDLGMFTRWIFWTFFWSRP